MTVGRRVVVTGLGLATSLGLEVQENWKKLLEGVSGIGELTLPDSKESAIRAVAQLSEADWQRIQHEFQDHSQAEGCRANSLALWAAQAALQDATLHGVPEIRGHADVITAAGIGHIRLEDLHQRLNAADEFDFAGLADGNDKLAKASLARYHTYRLGTLLASRLGLNGTHLTVTSACASATQAIGLAYRKIKRGEAELVLCGGSDSMIDPVGLVFLLLLTVASTSREDPRTVCRPFDNKRSGLVLGEGAGFVILEELSHALARNTPIQAEVVGYASSMDAYQVTAPDPAGRGAERCMRKAIQDANLKVGEIDYINAHGTATKLNDVAETLAIKAVFGDCAQHVAISASKSMVGHLMAAAGGPEFIYTVLSVKNDVIHPTINLDHPDPRCDLDYVPKVKRTKVVRAALSNSFGFGGQNATLVVKKYTGQRAL
jgi:3-oxoacyl-[acyl-carrier-protein] synthase II